MKCCLCSGPIDERRDLTTGEVYWTEGHNAEPVMNGRCCDECNATVVMTRRINNAIGGKDPYEGKGMITPNPVE